MSDGTDKITPEEMVEMFGERMPIEAVALLWDADNETTVGELRQKLRKAAREHKKSSMTDLLARLNACYVELNEDGLPCGYGDPLNPDGPEAADALTAQQAEIERLNRTPQMDHFQARIAKWCAECFGQQTADDKVERNWRFLEEALELVQGLGGNAEDTYKLVDYVFNRDPGDPRQEVGGTMVTLAALCNANSIFMSSAAFQELDRIERPEVMEKIRAKHASKPHKSPLPGDYKHAAVTGKKGGDG